MIVPPSLQAAVGDADVVAAGGSEDCTHGRAAVTRAGGPGEAVCAECGRWWKWWTEAP